MGRGAAHRTCSPASRGPRRWRLESISRLLTGVNCSKATHGHSGPISIRTLRKPHSENPAIVLCVGFPPSHDDSVTSAGPPAHTIRLSTEICRSPPRPSVKLLLSRCEIPERQGDAPGSQLLEDLSGDIMFRETSRTPTWTSRHPVVPFYDPRRSAHAPPCTPVCLVEGESFLVVV